MTIFISIASYRDPELVPTIESCLAQARWPDQLRFGICWQHGDDEAMPARFADSRRFRVLDVDWREAKGACWARAAIMSLWAGEEHFLQIDSHHRFARDWDAKLIGYAAACPSDKPILTTYCPMYVPGAADDELSDEPTRIDFDYFTEDGIALFKPGFVADGRSVTRPLRARFISGHFLFAPGSLVDEVPYDPGVYFHGEEIMLTVRAFTWGYDLFHPPEVLLWHEYSRQYRRKHWDDHVEEAPVERAWHRRDADSRDQVRRFFSAPHDGPFGCGPQRRVADYEAYAGLSFRHRVVQDYTWQGHEPPNPPTAADWADGVHAWRVAIDLDREQLPAAALDNAAFWYVGVHDACGVEIHRRDVAGDELRGLLASGSQRLRIERGFQSGQTPASWTVWPVSAQEHWLEQVTGRIAPVLT